MRIRKFFYVIEFLSLETKRIKFRSINSKTLKSWTITSLSLREKKRIKGYSKWILV